MSESEGPANTNEDLDIKEEHPISDFVEEYLGPVALLLNDENTYRIRRAFEAVMVALIVVGLVYWAFLLITQGI